MLNQDGFLRVVRLHLCSLYCHYCVYMYIHSGFPMQSLYTQELQHVYAYNWTLPEQNYIHFKELRILLNTSASMTLGICKNSVHECTHVWSTVCCTYMCVCYII